MSRRAVTVFLACVWPCAVVAQNTPAEREATPVAAPLAVTWAALEKVVRGEPNNGRLDVVQQGSAVKKGRWRMMIPSSDFRAGEWAVCQSGTESARAPRQGVFDVTVTGDSVAGTVLVTARWSAQDPQAEQQAIACRSTERYERELERNIRSRAEKEAKNRKS